jgi:hypothetical protein
VLIHSGHREDLSVTSIKQSWSAGAAEGKLVLQLCLRAEKL